MINGINYLKEKYPNRSEKDYQPAGLDLRIGKLYCWDVTEVVDGQIPFVGIVGGEKVLPKLREVEPVLFNSVDKEPSEVFILEPHIPYIAEVQGQIKIDKNAAQFYKPRSTLLRSFVTVDTAVGDPGYNGHLQFLIINHGFTQYYLEVGERFVQLVDMRVDGNNTSYDGDYQEAVK